MLSRLCRAFPLGRRRPDAEAASIIPTRSKRLRLAASAHCGRSGPPQFTEPQYSKATPATLSGASEIDADRDVTARQFGKGSCVRVQLCECFVLCQRLLYLSLHFPTGIARRDNKLPGPHTSVKPGKSKKLSTVLFEDCLRLLGGLDHFRRFVALEACKLYNSHDLIPPLSPRG